MPTFRVSIILGITGFLRGQVVHAMHQNFVYSVAKVMLPNKAPRGGPQARQQRGQRDCQHDHWPSKHCAGRRSETIDLTSAGRPHDVRPLYTSFFDIPTIALSLI
jgi:type II secretory pathway component PulJ